MKGTLLSAIVTLLVALSCAAPATCPGETLGAEVDAFVGGAVVLSPDAPATVTVGSEFAVVLEENPSTGYGWTYTMDPPGLAAETAEESFAAVPEPMPGSPVNTVWKFRADSAGEVVLTYLYYRPWEKPETAIKRMTYTVKIAK
jgi:predicted secreted protein